MWAVNDFTFFLNQFLDKLWTFFQAFNILLVKCYTLTIEWSQNFLNILFLFVKLLFVYTVTRLLADDIWQPSDIHIAFWLFSQNYLGFLYACLLYTSDAADE